MSKQILILIVLLILSGVLVDAFAQTQSFDSHIAIEDPADLSKEDARKIYDDLKSRMGDLYAIADLPEIEGYQSWKLFNDAPYVSATHGQRYVNNYANAIAVNYAILKAGEKLPVGSVLAKDSITVTGDGRIFPGAMFGMEKLAEGTSPETADWRYFMVIPDGSIVGDTTGDNPQLMTYCHECHLAVEDRDFTFYVPEGYRVQE
ncbi:cytochrome P460 family protein [uncultured Roseibium sp.]|uniref:cytochrome P460 family protein n=1 Tax=uncultured Roseibium sp. TaxID=1936171 RepID=UPI0026023269|nr:cytochrome P460 family protein [uncultured Roseibium sp.]